MIALNVGMIGSICLPHWVEVNALRLLKVCFSFAVVLENFGSKYRVISRIF